MSDGENKPRTVDLRWIVATTSIVLGTVALAALIYLLRDIFLLLFLGIVVAAALQPWHVLLSRWGIPKGLAVLLIYLVLLAGFVLIALVVGPVLMEQMSAFVTAMPGTYASIRSHLQASSTVPFHLIGQGLPPFERMTQTLTNVAPQFYESAVDVTKGLVELPAYFVTVLAIGFYWTIELPRFERLFLSLLAVEHRARALAIWHEIESKLGGFMRGQSLAMVSIASASALGFALIGLPNVLALAVFAGLLEAVPMIGPLLGAIPAILVAVPLGLNTVLSVIAFAVILQLLENNVLIPRIMHHAVGVSALIGLLAVLAFGSLYGILGIFIAIPTIAVIQVLLDSMLVTAESLAEPEGLEDGPWSDLRARIHALRQEARVRLRARTSRMGIDPGTADYVVDAIDQQIEAAAARVEMIISAAEATPGPMAAEDRAAMMEKLRVATEGIEHAVDRVAPVVPIDADAPTTRAPLVEPPLAEGVAPGRVGQAATPGDAVIAATADTHATVHDSDTAVVAAPGGSTQTHAAEEVRQIVDEIEEAIAPAKTANASRDAPPPRRTHSS